MRLLWDSNTIRYVSTVPSTHRTFSFWLPHLLSTSKSCPLFPGFLHTGKALSVRCKHLPPLIFVLSFKDKITLSRSYSFIWTDCKNSTLHSSQQIVILWRKKRQLNFSSFFFLSLTCIYDRANMLKFLTSKLVKTFWKWNRKVNHSEELHMMQHTTAYLKIVDIFSCLLFASLL